MLWVSGIISGIFIQNLFFNFLKSFIYYYYYFFFFLWVSKKTNRIERRVEEGLLGLE